MSRILAVAKGSPSRYESSTSPRYKIFIWDLGTDRKSAHEATIRSLAVLEYSSPVHEVAHFSTAVRPSHLRTKKTTPTLAEAWDDMMDFISNHSEGKPPLLVSHNAAFDVTVLLTEARRKRIHIPSSWRFACTLLLARSVYSCKDNSQLSLAARLGIRVSNPHDTKEDVIVLSLILHALDKKARDGKFYRRDVHAICSEAQPSSFFDRTPQYGSESKIYITNTGVKYHRGDCRWLEQSKIPRKTPAPGFEPCGTCRPDGDRYVAEKPQASSGRMRGTSANVKRQASSVAITSPRANQFFYTDGGRKYHTGACKMLGKSPIPVDNPPSNLKPCRRCIEDRRPNQRYPRVGGNVANSSIKSSSEETPYFVTRTGKRYHKIGCDFLKKSRIPIRSECPKNERHVDYEPCAVCLPDLAYQGSPKIRMYRNLHHEAQSKVPLQ